MINVILTVNMFGSDGSCAIGCFIDFFIVNDNYDRYCKYVW